LTESGAQVAEEFFLNSLTLEHGTLRPSRNVGNYQCTLRNTPEDWKYKVCKLYWVLHTNKCTNCISYFSLKLFTLKHFRCSYMFR
jgi:hypothetical protein